MITLITGAPGAGKTAALVDLLRSEGLRRALYVSNLNGLTLPHVPLEEPNKWPELVEDGAAIVIDEVQSVWRPRGNAAAVPDAIAKLETHRHRGLDFYLTTQHPGLLDANVRRLVGRHIHLRDVGLLGRWWYEWPEATNVESFRTAPVKKRYTLPKQAFGLYKSASLHIKPIRSVPRVVLVLGAAVLALGFLVHRGYASISGKIEAAQIKPEAPAAAASAAVSPARSVASPVAAAAMPGAIPEPERPQVVGCFSSARTCRCFDAKGFPIVVEWDLCRISSVGYAGLVPLDLSPTKPPAPAASELLVATR